MRPRHIFTVAALAAVVLVFVSGYDAFTASSTVAASKVDYNTLNFSVADLEPNECTMTVTSIKAGSGTFNATAQYQLVLGSNSKDTVTLQRNDCFVGGGPTAGATNKRDVVTGVRFGGDDCIVNSGATTTNCTVVANRP